MTGFPMLDMQSGHYVKEGLEELGHTVVAVNDPRVAPGAVGILEMVDTHKPDFVLLAKDIRYNDIIEELSKKVLTVMWNFDVRYDIRIFLNANALMFQHCHLKFTIGKGNIEKYREAGVDNIHWLSEGISPIWHCTESLSSKDHFAYDADIAFAGFDLITVHDGRHDVLTALKDFATKESVEFEHWTNVFNRAHNKMCQCTKVNIGHSGWPHVTLSMSARDYRIMGAGGFLLTNYVDGIEDWFEIGKMCDTYKTPGECIEKVEYYLANEGRRKLMAEYGQKIVLEKHKFSDRLCELISKVEEF